MTDLTFHTDPYLKTTTATVTQVHADGSVSLDNTIFFAMGGGQPGDTGTIEIKGTTYTIIDTRKGERLDDVRHVLAEGTPTPTVGDQVTLELDWDRRYKHMRLHSLLHLLCASVVGDVTGGQISTDKARLDFNLPDGPPDKAALQDKLNALVADDHAITQRYVAAAELDKNPALVRTMAVAPPSLDGKIRLVTIGDSDAPVDHQPCGGTHVARTGEIGTVVIGKIENKGRQNRRINLSLAD